MTAEQITRNDGGRPYLRMLSTNTHTAQKCIQELNTCTEIITIDQTRYCSLSPFKWLAFTLDCQAYHNLLGGLLIKKDKKRKRRRDSPCSNRACNPQYSSHVYWSNQDQPWGRAGRAAAPGPKSQEPPSHMCMCKRGLLKTSAHHPAWTAQPNLCDWSHLINQSATSSTPSPPLPSSRNACHAWSAASCSHFHIDFFSSGPA